MARILGVDIPNDKPIEIALTYIFGIGRTTSRKLLDETKIEWDVRTKNLTDEELSRITSAIEKRCGRDPGELLVRHREAVRGRGTASPSDFAEHPAAEGHQLLPRFPPPARSAGAGPADALQRPDPEGPAADGGREEVGQVDEVTPALAG